MRRGPHHICVPVFAFLVFSCVSSTNYYTGKTLKSEESVFVAGFEVNAMSEGFINESSNLPKVPVTASFGYSRGLDHNFEVGVRYTIPWLLEGVLRYQLPSRFTKSFDVSINGHGILSSWSTFKYGVTISREMYDLQPFVSFYNTTLDTGYKGKYEEMIRAINIGVGIPTEGGLIVPELNYQYSNYDKNIRIITVGIGFRIS